MDGTSPGGAAGLTSREAESRLVRYGRNELRNGAPHQPMAVLIEQFRSPFVLILLAAAALQGDA